MCVCLCVCVCVPAEKYKEWHAQFEGSRECKFLEQLLLSWDEKDVEKFTDAVFEFDQVASPSLHLHRRWLLAMNDC